MIVGRNDDYMQDFVSRLETTITWNNRHLADEVIFVEWNPPADRPLLAPTLTRRFESLRAFVVPEKIHRSLCLNHRVPLLEYHAKNVGVRRARLPWVVATNADVAFGLDTIRTLRSPVLEEGKVWTAQRIDVHWKEGRSEPIRIWDCMRYKRIIPYEKLGTGDFLLASRDTWHNARGYDESLVKHRIGCDRRGTAQMTAKGLQVDRAGTVMHLAHPTSCTEKIQEHHGEYAPLDGLPYRNGDDWGLGRCRETEIGERTWRLE